MLKAIKELVDKEHPDSLVKSGRSVPLDMLKAFAIFLVCWGHGIQYFSSTPYYEQPVYRVIYSFHMPLFMAMVGYFSSSLLERNFWSGLMKRFNSLIIPAWSFLIIGIVMGTTVIASASGLIDSVLYGSWFLKSAFACAVLFSASCRWRRFRVAGLILSLLLSQYFQGRLLFNIMYPCFILGYLMRRYFNFIKVHRISLAAIGGFIFIVMLMPWDARFWNMPSVTFNPMDSYFASYWFKTCYRIIIGCVGTVTLFCLFHLLFTNKELIMGGVLTIGKSTLGIYLIQGILLEKVLASRLCFDHVSFGMYNFLITPLAAIAVLIVCMVLISLVRKSHFSSRFLLGQATR